MGPGIRINQTFSTNNRTKMYSFIFLGDARLCFDMNVTARSGCTARLTPRPAFFLFVFLVFGITYICVHAPYTAPGVGGSRINGISFLFLLLQTCYIITTNADVCVYVVKWRRRVTTKTNANKRAIITNSYIPGPAVDAMCLFEELNCGIHGFSFDSCRDKHIGY